MLSLELISDKESGMAWVCTSGCPSRTYVRQKLFNKNWFKSGRQCNNLQQLVHKFVNLPLSLQRVSKTTRFLQKIMHYLRHTFVILSQKHCISAAQTLRCCMNPLSRFGSFLCDVPHFPCQDACTLDMLSPEQLSDDQFGMAWVCTSVCPSRTYVGQKQSNKNWFKSGRLCNNLHNSCANL